MSKKLDKMYLDVPAKSTLYEIWEFRSKLEAHWAVFFDAMKCEWQYEPKVIYCANNRKYLPDFYLPSFGFYFEIKPNGINGYREDLRWLSMENLIVLSGYPWEYMAYDHSGFTADMGTFGNCPICNSPMFGYICSGEFSGISSCSCRNGFHGPILRDFLNGGLFAIAAQKSKDYIFSGHITIENLLGYPKKEIVQ